MNPNRKLKSALNEVHSTLVARGRKYISDYHVILEALKQELLPDTLRPEAFGYLHGLNKNSSLSIVDRHQALKAWTHAVLSSALGGFSCNVCGSNKIPTSNRGFLKDGWPEWCSPACSLKHPINLQKRDATFVRKYGITFSEYKSKQITECNKRKSQDTLSRASARRNATLAEKFGSLPAFYAHLAETRKATWTKKYGVDNPSKSAAVFARQNSYRVKTVKISGKTFKVQGYEEGVIRCLVNEGIPVSRIHNWRTDLPTFRYSFKGADLVYHPDLLVDGKIVEVKSSFTLGLFRSEDHWKFLKLKAKARAVERDGYSFILALSHRKVVYYFTASQLRLAYIRKFL